MADTKIYLGMVVTDLDGTLNHPSGEFTAANRLALEELGAAGYLRVVATGRSLFFARKQLPGDFPVDYVVFSSGAGTVDWRSQNLIVKHQLSYPAVVTIRQALISRGIDFMIHDPIPDNHHFAYWESGNYNPDFLLRRQRQASYARRLDDSTFFAVATQFLAVVPQERALQVHEELKLVLRDCNVIRATSPLDRRTAWLEIFGRQVSKSQGAAWVAERHGLNAAKTLAVGNDYNDWDLLHWAGTSRVVADSPPELLAAFTAVGLHHESGFAEAVRGWLSGQ